MLNQKTHVCSDYLEAVFRRARNAMEPKDFHPNWDDQPSRYKIYQDVERIPLPVALPTTFSSMATALELIAHPQMDPKGLTYEEISTILLLTHGVINRRLDVNWNRDAHGRAKYAQATLGRGTASGGGMYPTEIFWACGPGGPLQTGIYHYDNAHHAMGRLYSGDVTTRIQVALAEHPAAMSTNQFLLVSLNFWKNSFKYSSFCYHVVTEDLGALLGSLRLMTIGFGSDLQFLLWYPDEEFNCLLGLETLFESVFTIIPLPMNTTPANPLPAPDISRSRVYSKGLNTPLVTKSSFQRSQLIIRFPMVEEVHIASLVKDEQRPTVKEAYKASCDDFANFSVKIALPEPATELLQCNIIETFKKRKSSFGRFSSHIPLTLNQFATMLYFASASGNYVTDLKAEDGLPHITSLMAFVNNVSGLERGAYAYDWQRHSLGLVVQQDFSLFLQENYFLQNYNLSEIAALIVIVGRPERMLEIYGNRGLRILNIEVGLMAQSLYMAAAALSFNCGAALGFDNIALNTALGLDETDQRSFLFLMVGNAPNDNATFESQLF
jgi:SagB-type dehydrogenase family enzyme